MRKILLLVPMNFDDFYEYQSEIEEGFKNNPFYVYFSPSFLTNKDRKKPESITNKSFILELIASVIAIDDMNFNAAYEFGLKENQTMTHVGPAPKSLEFDEIYTLHYDIINEQEAFYDYYIKPKTKEIDIYKSEDATEDFKSIDNFLMFIKEAPNV
jgi:hypothetical protein